MFQRHSLIHTSNNSLQYLIVDVNYQHGKVAYFDLNYEPTPRKSISKSPKVSTVRPKRVQSKPRHMSFEDLNHHLSSFDYQVERAEYQNELYVPAHYDKLRRDGLIQERTAKADELFELIRPIIEDDDKRYEYLYTDRGNRHIKELSVATGVKASQISRLLSQYFFRGSCRSAMHPNYRYCGCNYQPVLEVKADLAKRGRKAKYTEYRNLLPKDEENIRTFLRKLGKRLYSSRGYTQKYRLYDYYYQGEDEVVINDEGLKSTRKIPRPQSDCISFQQFYNYLKKLEADRTFAWSKNGQKQFLKEYESRFGRARDGVYGPSFRYEIDATVEDVYLFFPYFTEQRLSSGRPTTYRVSCVYSGMVVGIHVGVGGPNWQGVLQALYNACSDKVDFCDRYGIPIEHEQWPCNVVPTELTIDNGVEYPSKNMEQFLSANLGIDCINYTAIYSGKSKGGVEGGFQVDKRDIIQDMPGYVERIPEKGDAHGSNFGIYTYYEFVQLLIVQTLIRNNEVYKKNIHDQVMSQHGVSSTSLAVWDFGMKHYMNGGRNKRFPKEQLLFALLPSGKASTTSRGIVFKKLHYSCKFAHSQGWLSDSKNRPVKKLEVRYFDSDTNWIWYKHEGKVYAAELNDHSEIYRNQNWFDAMNRLTLYNKERAILKAKEREARFQQQDIKSDITGEAKSRIKGTKAATSKSPKGQLKTIAYLEKKMQDQNTSSLLRDILGTADSDGHYKVAADAVAMPVLSVSKNKKLEAMYGSTDNEDS